MYVLATVMTPRYSRSILFSILKANPRSGGTGAGTYTENGTQYPGLVYSEVNTPLAIERKRNLRTSGFALRVPAWIFTIGSKNTIHG